MGTDIHAIVQIMSKKKWETIPDKVSEDRSYATFAVLANIGNRSIFNNSIKMVRGLPDDFEHEDFYTSPVNSDTKYWLGTFSYSYYTLLELLETNVSFEDTYIFNWIIQLLEIKKKYKVSTNSVRVVFGFDN